MSNQAVTATLLPQILVSMATYAGRKGENQDSILVQTIIPTADFSPASIANAWLLTAVADGVSACQAPKTASELAIRTLTRQLLNEQSALFSDTKTPYITPELILQAIAKSVQHANDRLYFSEGEQRPPPLLSTLSGIVFTQQAGFLFHTGDSRVYRYRQSDLTLLSHDHRHTKGRDKGALSSALGADAHVELQFAELDMFADDLFVIMTDGVYEHLSDEELRVLVQGVLADTGISHPHLTELPEKLCRSAMENGSADNVSCVAIAITGQPLMGQTPAGQIGAENLTDSPQKNTLTLTLTLPPLLQAGDTLDNFTITQVISHTTRSTVYLATDTQGEAGNQRIIKVPSAYFEDDSDYLRQFLKEEKIGLSLNHDSLLKFYPKSPNSPYLYHVTEYVAGMSLRAFLDSQPPLSLAQTHEIVQKIGLALRVMHRNYLLHQDVKPENVILTPNGEIKLIDFGSVGSLLLKNALTPPAGDLHYTAPEYYTHAPKGVYSDLFSLGVMTYEMLTGNQPFDIKDLASGKEAKEKNRTGQMLGFTEVRQLRPELPFWVNDVLVRALHPDGASRYQSLGEFLSDLNPQSHASDTKKSAPFIVRQPVRFWQMVSGILLGLLILSWMVLKK